MRDAPAPCGRRETPTRAIHRQRRLSDDSVKPVGPQRQGCQSRAGAQPPFSSRTPVLLPDSPTARSTRRDMATRADAYRTNDLYIEDSDRLDEPFGGVQVRVEQADGHVVVRADWGGWSWRAEGIDRRAALSRLNRRLARLDPFDSSDEDWGPPGHQT